VKFKKLLVRILALWGAVTLVLMVCGLAALFFAGSWLNNADPVAKVDALVVLAGAPERAMHAADLFLQGHASVVYVSRPARERGHHKLEEYGITLPTEECVNRTILNRRGVDDARIRVYSRGSVNTLDEAYALRTALPPTTRAIMIVTSPYHVRRVKMLFGDVFEDSGIEVRVIASPYEPFPDRWWSDQEAARQTVLEILKLAFYRLGGSYSQGSRHG
jgi:uncharacterized SAM-binding protein YcdF (DUF218 family)